MNSLNKLADKIGVFAQSGSTINIGKLHVEGELSSQEYRNRQALLAKVKNNWVKGVLEQPLHGREPIKLNMYNCPDMVVTPANLELATKRKSRTPLLEGISIVEAFDLIGTGRTLLILGLPGSGKTNALLQLAKVLIERAEQDADHLIPIVLNLSSWKGKPQSIADWVIEKLSSEYHVPKAIGQPWVKQQRLLLLLDGLDEVKLENRDDCVTALNIFQQEQATEMVVCSRMKDYRILSNRLKFLQSAIFICPLTSLQVQQHLDQMVADSTGLETLLANDRGMRRLARSPLMLYFMVEVYQGVPIEALPQADTLEKRRKQLFDTYIARMFERRIAGLQYSKERTIGWLSWLAEQMLQESQTVFLIEQMQPTWLEVSAERHWYRTGVVLLSGLIGGLSFGLSIGFLNGLYGALEGGLIGMVMLGQQFGLNNRQLWLSIKVHKE
jgi:hypothetical protein